MSKATRAVRFGTRLPRSVARREAKIAMETAVQVDGYAYRYHHWYSRSETDENGNPKITSTIEVRVWPDGRTKVTACDPSGRPLKQPVKLRSLSSSA